MNRFLLQTFDSIPITTAERLERRPSSWDIAALAPHFIHTRLDLTVHGKISNSSS